MLTLEIIQTVTLIMIFLTISALYGEVKLQHGVINNTYVDMLKSGMIE